MLEECKTSFSDHERSTTLTGTSLVVTIKVEALAELEPCFLGSNLGFESYRRTNHSYVHFSKIPGFPQMIKVSTSQDDAIRVALNESQISSIMLFEL